MADVFHGGRLDAAIAQYGGERKEWIDLSTGINPNAYPLPEISSDAWSRLPEASAENALREAARTAYNVSAAAGIVIANGTQAIIEMLPRLGFPGRVAIVGPTYGEHEHVWRKSGYQVKTVADLTHIDTEEIAVVVNPNNPDCRNWKREELFEIAGKVQCLIVDEAFADALPDESLCSALPDNVIVLRSFGKFYGLAGVRLGFAVCLPKWADALQAMAGPWAVSGAAIEIGCKALNDKTWRQETRTELARKSEALSDVLAHAGLEILGVNPLFVYAYHLQAGALNTFLLEKRILVRPFPDYPNRLRLGLCRDDEELNRLSNTLKAFTDV